jgi:hypothetical protein
VPEESEEPQEPEAPEEPQEPEQPDEDLEESDAPRLHEEEPEQPEQPEQPKDPLLDLVHAVVLQGSSDSALADLAGRVLGAPGSVGGPGASSDIGAAFHARARRGFANRYVQRIKRTHGPFTKCEVFEPLAARLRAARRASGIPRSSRTAITSGAERAGGVIAVGRSDIKGADSPVIGASKLAGGHPRTSSPFAPRTDREKLPHTHGHAEQAVADELKDMFERLPGMNPSTLEGNVWMVVEEAVCPPCMNDVLSQFSAAYPSLQVEVKNLESNRILRYERGTLKNR